MICQLDATVETLRILHCLTYLIINVTSVVALVIFWHLYIYIYI